MDNDKHIVHNSYMQAYNNYVRAITESNSRNTVRVYTNFIDKFYQYLSSQSINLDLPVNSLIIDQLITFVKDAIQYSDYSKSTVSLMIAGLKSFHNWLIDNNYLDLGEEKVKELNDYFKNVLSSNLATRTIKTVESITFVEEIPIYELVAAAKLRKVSIIERERDMAILLFFISSDILPNELCKLMTNDFDNNGKSVMFQISDSETRQLHISSELFDAINRYWSLRGWHKNNDPAFARHDRGVGKKHMSLTTRSIQNIIGNISEAAGFGRIITANMLRNNYYLRVIDYDIDLSNVEISLKHGIFTTRCQY